jgi:dihydrofolate synthase / folylpolyglutamate synthase
MDPGLSKILSTYDELVDWEIRDRSKMNVGLAALRDLLQHLNEPQKEFRAVHIAGTKGKGSVAALIEAGLSRAGLACGRFSSPHVERITERITFGGDEISEDILANKLEQAWFAREAARIRGTPGLNATRFDLETLAAILAFVHAKVAWGVVECGLGGRFDSTNVIDGEVCVLTNVGLEHTAVLGTTHAAIAFQKVGILKSGATMITGVPPDSAAGQIVFEEAAKQGCLLKFCSTEPDETIAETNTRMAEMVLDEIGRRGIASPDPQFSKRMIGGWLIDEATRLKACLPGRLEYFELPVVTTPSDELNRESAKIPVILDGAHVPFSLAAILHDVARIRKLRGFCVVVFGTGRDKQAFEMLKLLKNNRVDVVICTRSTMGPRAWDPEELRRFADELELVGENIPQASQALVRATELATGGDWVLVTGSLHIIGEIRPKLRELGALEKPIPRGLVCG